MAFAEEEGCDVWELGRVDISARTGGGSVEVALGEGAELELRCTDGVEVVAESELIVWSIVLEVE